MLNGKDRYSCSVTDGKRDFRHIRNTRFMAHPYQSSQQHLPQTRQDSSVPNDATPLANTSYMNSRVICDIHQPESPFSTETHAEQRKLTDTIKLPENLENLPKADEFPTRRNRWNTNEEILALLLNLAKHESWQSKDVVIRPESGSMLMYSRKKVRYRRDGYCWKKRKDGKTTREDHMKLKVQGVECIYGCYVHSAVLPTFHRRCYWLLQNPDIVLVHYLNVPYPDDSKLAALIPNIAFWTEKKEWTREELLLQLKPMYENPAFEGLGVKEADTEDAKLNRANVSSFIESMICQLLEKQRYVRTALANSVECGCGNRKCTGASRCTRPIRRISSAKKQSKRANLGIKLQEKRISAVGEVSRNLVKTTAIRKINTSNIENRLQMSQRNSAPAYYNSSIPINSDSQTTTRLSGQETQQMEQILHHSNLHQPNMIPSVSQSHESHSKSHQLVNMIEKIEQNSASNTSIQMTNIDSFYGNKNDPPVPIHYIYYSPFTGQHGSSTKDLMTNYQRSESYVESVDLVNVDEGHYQPNYSCPVSQQYVPNNEIEITNEEKRDMKMNSAENAAATLLGLPYGGDGNDFASERYQSDATEGSDCHSYSTAGHRASSSPGDSYASVEEADAYAGSDLLDDLMTNVNCGYHTYENEHGHEHEHENERLDDGGSGSGSGSCDYVNTTDRSLYELVIQLTQKEKKSTCGNSVVTTCEKVQQYEIQNQHSSENYPSTFENNGPPVADANANFLNACPSRYSTVISSDERANCAEHSFGSDFTRIENSHITNYSAEIDVNYTNITNEFCSNERTISTHSVLDCHHVETACAIVELAPEWSYCEGGTKLLIVGPWYFPSEYAVLFDSYSVPATLVQAGVLKCYCPEHTVGLVSLQVASGGSIISNAAVFEYKKRSNAEESQYHNFCNIKAEQYNQYTRMYENDTLLKFILIHRIESIQDDAYTHGSSLINKYEDIREKATI